MMNPGSIGIELRLGSHSRTDSHGHNAACLKQYQVFQSNHGWMSEEH